MFCFVLLKVSHFSKQRRLGKSLRSWKQAHFFFSLVCMLKAVRTHKAGHPLLVAQNTVLTVPRVCGPELCNLCSCSLVERRAQALQRTHLGMFAHLLWGWGRWRVHPCSHAYGSQRSILCLPQSLCAFYFETWSIADVAQLAVQRAPAPPISSSPALRLQV